MIKAITVRFYQVGKMSPHGPSFRQALQQIMNAGQPGERESQLSGGFRCRLERLQESAGFVSGEMMRVRDTDFPCEVRPTGTVRLGVDGPIGDGVAFRFREADNRLAMQYDARVLSPGRFLDYIGVFLGAPLFHSAPTIDDAAIERFRNQPLRKLKIRLARPTNLADVENAMAPVAAAMGHLSQDYDAPVITLEMSMGHEKGQLGEGAKQMAEGFLHMVGAGADVRSLVATSDMGEGVENEEINLLDHLLSVKNEIEILGDEPVEIYGACAAHVRQVLDAHG